MIRKTILRHCIAVFAILFFGVLSLASSCSSTPWVSETKGVVLDVPPYDKPFTSLGMIFVTSTITYDSYGKVLSSSTEEGLLTMLLREAHALGGDNILNFRVDEYIINERGGNNIKIVKYTGSAMAIKYLDEK